MEVPGIPCCSHDPTSFLTLASVTLRNWQPWSNCREVPLCFTFLVDARPPVARQLAILWKGCRQATCSGLYHSCPCSTSHIN